MFNFVYFLIYQLFVNGKLVIFDIYQKKILLMNFYLDNIYIYYFFFKIVG